MCLIPGCTAEGRHVIGTPSNRIKDLRLHCLKFHEGETPTKRSVVDSPLVKSLQNAVRTDTVMPLVAEVFVENGYAFNGFAGRAWQKLLSRMVVGWEHDGYKSRWSVVERIDGLAVAEEEILKAELQKVNFVGLSCDEWASRKAHLPFLSVVAHFIHPDSKTYSTRLLAIVPMPDGTTETCAAVIQGVTNSYGITENAISLTTDGAAVMMAITRSRDASTLVHQVAEGGIDTLVHVRCIAHAVNLGLKATCVKATAATQDFEKAKHNKKEAEAGLGDAEGGQAQGTLRCAPRPPAVGRPPRRRAPSGCGGCPARRQGRLSAPPDPLRSPGALSALLGPSRRGVRPRQPGQCAARPLQARPAGAVCLYAVPLCSTMDERVFCVAALFFTPWRQLLDRDRGAAMIRTKVSKGARAREASDTTKSAATVLRLVSNLPKV